MFLEVNILAESSSAVKMWKQQHKYEQLPISTGHVTKTSGWRQQLWTYLNLGLFMISLLILWTSSVQNSLQTSMAESLRRTARYSPIFDRLEIDFVEKRMNATLLPSPTDQIFRDDPSPEVDRAWRRISNEQPIALSKEEVIALGKDPSEAVQYPESFGLGESYAGRIDVFHQIHCLDALRREAHWNYYYASKYPDLEHSTKLHQVHLSHCIYYLLQNIMCQASVDVYTHVWTDSLLQPFPDFNTTKTCRNFDAVLNWQERNGVDLEEFYKLRKPREFEGMWIMEEAFKDVWREFEWWNPEGERRRDGTKTG